MNDQTEVRCEGARKRLTAIDLFCGAGGLSLGLQAAGFDLKLAADSWDLAIESYRRNFPHPAVCADLAHSSGEDLLHLAQLSRGSVDLVAGGPPCQGFSVQRIGRDDDVRNSLVMHFARLVVEMSPRFFLMENVPGLWGKRGRSQLSSFTQTMRDAGYACESHVINAAEFGVPQIRKRLFVIGCRQSGSELVHPPRPTHSSNRFVTVDDAIGDLPAPVPPGNSETADPLHRASRMSPLNLERLKHIPPGGGMENLPVELRVNCHKAGAEKIGHRYVYGRLHGERPASTITARFDSFTRGRFAHPHNDRNITLREGARLQTFPDTFQFKGNREEIAAQIGNAVPPRLAARLGEAIAQTAAATRTDTNANLPSESSAQPLAPTAIKQLRLALDERLA